MSSQLDLFPQPIGFGSRFSVSYNIEDAVAAACCTGVCPHEDGKNSQNSERCLIKTSEISLKGSYSVSTVRNIRACNKRKQNVGEWVGDDAESDSTDTIAISVENVIKKGSDRQQLVQRALVNYT